MQVLPENVAPTIGSDDYTTQEDDVLAVSVADGVLENDSDSEGRTVFIESHTEPSNGNLTFIQETGSFAYTPDADFNGSDSFEYTIREQETLLALGSNWKYLDDGSDQGTSWRDTAFDDSLWAEGPAQLGYSFEEADEATFVSYGSDAKNKHVTTYFRTTFDVADANAFSTLDLNFLVDDAAIVYLNGQEFFRTQNAESDMAFDEHALWAIRSTNERYRVATHLPSSLLVDGTNTLAVEVKTHAPNDSDLSFDLALEAASLSTTGTVQIDVTPVNDAPILDSSTTLDVGEFLTGFSNSVGVAVGDALVSHPTDFITDIDSGAVEGIAVHSVDDSNGTWQFSTDDGATWTSFSDAGVSATADYSQGLLLSESSRIRFISNEGFNGAAQIEVRAWDRSTGAAGEIADTSVTGGETAFSDEVGVAQADVVGGSAYSVDVPLLYAVEEGQSVTFSSATHNAVTVDWNHSTTDTIDVTLSVASGTLQLGPNTTGTSVVAGANGTSSLTVRGTEADINQALDGLVFTAGAVGMQQIDVSVDYASSLLELEFENSSNIGEDSSTTLNHATEIGTPSIVVDAERGSVLELDGSSGLKLSNSVGQPIDVTLAAWIHVNHITGGISDFIALEGDSVGLYMTNSRLVGFYDDGPSHYQFIHQVDLTDGWHHVAYTLDTTNSQQTLYVDGVAVKSDGIATPIEYATGDSMVGVYHTQAIQFFDGMLDDVRAFGSALSADEIASLALAETGDGETFDVEVLAENVAPTLGADSYSVDEDDVILVMPAGGVLSNDSDPEGRDLFIEGHT
ncbi:MAG: Ig-like domain-containing protein, partial [Planctomycetota bacterium]